MEYTSISEILKKEYGQKIYKLSLQSGCSCPNRDGTVGTGGCTFCSEGGSGDFAAKTGSLEEQWLEAKSGNLDEQIIEAKTRVDRKIPSKIPAENRKYIAYFQSFTNTWGDRGRLKDLYRKTIMRDDIAILSVATRPDSIDEDWIEFFCKLNQIKPVWIELGLQTCNDGIAEHVNRGYKTLVYEDTYIKLKEADLTVITHFIFGLPGEEEKGMLDTVRFVSSLYEKYLKAEPDIRSDGVKLQLLHVLKGTRLCEEYLETPFHILTMEEYISLVVSALSILSSKIVIHRLTGDGPKSLLLEPQWSADKKRVLNAIHKAINEN